MSYFNQTSTDWRLSQCCQFHDKKLAKQYHPDRNKDSTEEKMAQINKAYEVLSDKKLKHEYDKFCKLL